MGHTYDTDAGQTLDEKFSKDDRRIQRSEKRSNGWCISIMQGICTVYNTILIFIGVMFMSIAIYILSKGKNYIQTPQDNLLYALLVAMSAGVLVMSVGVLGLYGALTRKWAPNVMYMICIVPIIAIQLVVAVGSSFFEDKFWKVIDIGVKYAFERYGNMTDPNGQIITLAIDMMQMEFGCCGNTNKDDWTNSSFTTYWTTNKHRRSTYPDSCCNGTTIDVEGRVGSIQSLIGNGTYALCATHHRAGDIEYYFNDEGCQEQLKNLINKDYDVIIGVVFFLFALEILVLIFGCIFMDMSPREKRIVKKLKDRHEFD